MKKEFSKFFVASLKRTAQNVSPLVRRKQKLQAEIAEREEELKSIQVQLDTYEAPIKEATAIYGKDAEGNTILIKEGYTTEDLVVRTVEVTDKVDKDGKPVKVTKWNLRYPETIVPVEEGVAEPADESPEAPEAGTVEAPAETLEPETEAPTL